MSDAAMGIFDRLDGDAWDGTGTRLRAKASTVAT
jgi:hypothetical protein